MTRSSKRSSRWSRRHREGGSRSSNGRTSFRSCAVTRSPRAKRARLRSGITRACSSRKAPKGCKRRDGFRAEQRARTGSEISRSLVHASEVEHLVKVLAPGLPILDVIGCYVATYEDPAAPLEWANLIAWCDENGEQPLPAGGIRFRSRDLVPAETFPDRPVHFVLQTLEHQTSRSGFFLIEVGVRRGTFYDELRQQLSSALFRIERDKELARLHVAEQERSRQLLAAHQTLQENQDKLLIAEKMAALGRVTAGIAHEMNTPVASVRAALGELDKLVQEYAEAVNDPNMSADTHREIAGEMREAIRLGTSAAVKVAGIRAGHQVGDCRSRPKRERSLRCGVRRARHADDARSVGCAGACRLSFEPRERGGSPHRAARSLRAHHHESGLERDRREPDQRRRNDRSPAFRASTEGSSSK